MNYALAMVYKDTMCADQKVCVKLVPHKRKLLGSILVQDCHSLREAQLITTTSAEGVEKRFSYTYIGGGVPWQPQFTYPLVTRELSLEVVDRLMAVFVCLGLTKLSRDMFVRKQNTDISSRLSLSDKEDEITARIELISAHIVALQALFQSRERMIAELFPEPDVVMQPLVYAAEQPSPNTDQHAIDLPEPEPLDRCALCGDVREILPGMQCPLCAP